MPRTFASLTLDDAKQMLSAAEAKAASLGIPTASPWSMPVVT